MKITGLNAAALVLAWGALAGCSMQLDDNTPKNASEKATAACKADADRTFLKQNRSYLTQQSTMDSPFSSSGLPDVPSSGASDAFGRDQQISDCLRNAVPPAPQGSAPANAGQHP